MKRKNNIIIKHWLELSEKKKVVWISLCFSFYYYYQRLKDEKNLDQLACGRDRAASVVSCEWWSVSYISYFMAVWWSSAEEQVLQWQGGVAHGCCLSVRWPSPHPALCDKPAAFTLQRAEQSKCCSPESTVKISSSSLSHSIFLGCWSSSGRNLPLGASLSWHCLLQHHLGPSSGESCILYYFHVDVVFFF